MILNKTRLLQTLFKLRLFLKPKLINHPAVKLFKVAFSYWTSIYKLATCDQTHYQLLLAWLWTRYCICLYNNLQHERQQKSWKVKLNFSLWPKSEVLFATSGGFVFFIMIFFKCLFYTIFKVWQTVSIKQGKEIKLICDHK